MTATIEQPESEEIETAPLTVEQLQAILDDHFDGAATLTQVPHHSGELDDRLTVNYCRCLNDGGSPIACTLSNALRELAAKCLASASRIDEQAGYRDEPEFYVRPPAGHRVAISGLDEDFDIDIFNAHDDDDAIRQAREAIAFMTVGRPIRRQPENAGPISPISVSSPEHRFHVDAEKFDECAIVVINKTSESSAQAEATAFIEWLQAQAAPQAASEPALRIA